ncbi:MAG: PEP-CTERM system histidine kinase PrsK [Woeseiaceae bacterium]|nr:PEP-CTERM system histidine kinase PrsK [Woeseiaceae bacterium]
MLPTFALIGYVAAAGMFLLLAVLVLVGGTRAKQARLLLVAVLVNVVWSVAMFWQLRYGSLPAVLQFSVEIARYWAWLLFLVAVLGLAGGRTSSGSLRYGAIIAPGLILIIGVLPAGWGFGGPGSIFVLGSIGLSLLGIAILERIYRSAEPSSRRPIRSLALAVAGLFGFDIVMFSSSVLVGQIEPGLWAARGVANACIVPFLAVAVRQSKEWSVDLFISRQVAYFSATMVGAGIYLILMGVGGYYVKEFGGSLGSALAAILVFAAVLGGAALLLSEQLRRQVRVFFAKHFFRNRYDYREEWQRLSRILYDPKAERSMGERSIEAAALIMSSRSGFLLLQREGPTSAMLPFAAWHCPLPEGIRVAPGDGVVRFLESSSWVIDTRQYRTDRGIYGELELPEWLESDNQRLVVPLLQDTALIGLLVLDQDSPVTLHFEDTDLLKIVGRQVAGLLAQQLDAERVAEGRQFQAYSRLTAFLMHDLKNLAAQQSLVVKNASKHKRNPDFVDDAFETIEHSVNRMNRLIAQLAERNRKERRKRVSVGEVLGSVIEQVSDRKPVPNVAGLDREVAVRADHEKLSAIFVHLIRNAQDACDEQGNINISIGTTGSTVEVSVKDDGHGMDDTFIREQLFRPFESTKGVDGMGIGAYQVREYVRELDGHLDVDSTARVGTTMTVCLPRAV